jgi:serine kinase of HPr protein (carbohydrate metabolism regulator)
MHASCVALRGRAILLRGPSGCGKSDLALRMIDRGFSLVADDQVMLTAEKEQLFATPPPALAGLIEVRGLGILSCPYEASARLCLIADLTPAHEIVRMPEPRHMSLCGLEFPLLAIAPFELAAPIKLAWALENMATG